MILTEQPQPFHPQCRALTTNATGSRIVPPNILIGQQGIGTKIYSVCQEEGQGRHCDANEIMYDESVVLHTDDKESWYEHVMHFPVVCESLRGLLVSSHLTSQICPPSTVHTHIGLTELA